MRAQVVWLNGTFGVGKSSAARKLADTRADAHVFEPEWIGYLLKCLPASPARRQDYQQLRLWRSLTRWSLLLLSRARHGVLIVPMTMVEPQPRGETIDALRRAGITVIEVVLTASQNRIAARMDARGSSPGNWGLRQFTRCTARLQHILEHDQATKVHTDDLDLDEVVEIVAQLLP